MFFEGDWYFAGKRIRITEEGFKEIQKGAGLPLLTIQDFVDYLNESESRINKFEKRYSTIKGAPTAGKGWKELSPSIKAAHIEKYRIGQRLSESVEEPAQLTPFATPISSPATSPISSPVKMSAQNVLADAITAIAELARATGFVDYSGFDPSALRTAIAAKGAAAGSLRFKVGDSDMNFHGQFVSNDIACMVYTALNRGNNVRKIIQKSSKELQAVLSSLTKVYNITSNVENKSSITLMRVVQCFPQVAHAYLAVNLGHPIVSTGSKAGLLNHPVGFQKVSERSFSKYAWHFFTLAVKIDQVIGKRPTSNVNLWNYLVIGFTSKMMSSADRVDNIGEPVWVDDSQVAGEGLDKIRELIRLNKPLRVE